MGARKLSATSPAAVPSMPDMSLVVSACELLARGDVAAIDVSLPGGDPEALLALTREIAGQYGVEVEVNGTVGTLAMRFTIVSRRERR